MKILNLGSLNFDKVYDIEHFVSAGETILADTFAEFFGGKGLNQSIALARAGARVYHAGAIGTDGDAMADYLQAAGVDVQYLAKLPTVSGHAVIQSVAGQNCIIVYGGANSKIECSYIDKVLSAFEKDDIMLVQNEVSNVPYAISCAKKRGMQVALNASPITSQILQYPLEQVDYFLINEVEGKALTGIKTENFDSILDALHNKYPQAAIILTIGKQGVLYQDANTKMQHSVFNVPVVDTTAAGDTFCGYFIAGVAKKLNVSDNLHLASIASSLSVSKKGAANSIPTFDEVMAFDVQQKEEKRA